MKREDFKIGEQFYTGSGRWICTDKGTKNILAIKTEDHSGKALLSNQDWEWIKGKHEDMLHVSIFHINDWDGCSLKNDWANRVRRER
jgi:hypothetical protein